MIDFLIEIPYLEPFETIHKIFIKKPSFIHRFTNDEIEFLTWGDSIISEEFYRKLANDPSIECIVNNVFGHHYYILLNKISNKLYLGNSLFGILPVYHFEVKNKVIISNNVQPITHYINNVRISRQFVLETVLFNYPLFSSSIFEGIHLLPANSAITCADGNWTIEKHTTIADLFTDSPVNWRRCINQTRDTFLESTQKYMPDCHYVNSLTGGFDSRTLVSAGLLNKKDFSSYAFGSPSSEDTKIAALLCQEANLPFIQVDLDHQYAYKQSLDSGLEFVRNASALGSFSRAHYLYSIKQLASKTEYILTGNFGSEIFRSAHNLGVIISPNLYLLFKSASLDHAIKCIEDCNEYKYLKKASFHNEWEQLKNDLLSFPGFNPTYKKLSKNQKFYIFVFEEIFRKYFGAEMVNQFKYLKNRTPYLDIDFLKAVFKTDLAGIHAGFFEHNPFRRFKGQILYAHIIDKSYPAFGKILTNKGYRPSDLLSFPGKVNIAIDFIRKRVTNNSVDTDPNSVDIAYKSNETFYKNIPISQDIFNTAKISNDIFHNPNEVLYKVLSMSYLSEEIIHEKK